MRQEGTGAKWSVGRLRIYFEHFWNDFAALSKTKLNMPVLAIGGPKADGELSGQQMKLV